MLSVIDIKMLQGYIRSVVARAGHHATNISEVIPVVFGNVIIHGDKFALRGPDKNVAWFETAKGRYAVAYERRGNNAYRIEIRLGSQQGPVVFACDNTTPVRDINDAFRAM